MKTEGVQPVTRTNAALLLERLQYQSYFQFISALH